jgi:hypothetical protein
MDPLRLCAGTLVVDHPDQVLLDHLDPRNGYAVTAYDRLVTNGSPVLVDGDLLAPNLIGTEAPYAGRGVRGTILSKVLHRKRPDLVPLYDSRIFESYTAPGAVERSAHRSWRDSMTLLLRQMRADLQAEAAPFAALVEVSADAGQPLTRLRILDVLVWRAAEAWH